MQSFVWLGRNLATPNFKIQLLVRLHNNPLQPFERTSQPLPITIP